MTPEQAPGAPVPITGVPAMTKVTLTPAARDLIGRIQAEHGEIVLVQDSGCVCGDAPQVRQKSLFHDSPAGYLLETDVARLTLWRSRKLDRDTPPDRIMIDAQPGRRGGFALENAFDAMLIVVVQECRADQRVPLEPNAASAERRAIVLNGPNSTIKR
jgi:uncharacterized protein (DUF779 family)